MSAAELFTSYALFGEDPFIVATPAEGTDVLFSARDYASRRCDELCAPVQDRHDEADEKPV